MSFSRKEKHPRASRSQPVYPWSAHSSSPFGLSPSPFPRNRHSLSTRATAAGELYLFGGYENGSKTPSNDLHVISTRNFSTTLLQTGGKVPSPRYGHTAVITGTTLLIWGGKTDFSDQNAQNPSNDDSFYSLNLVSREWTRIVVNGPGPGGRYFHTMTLVGSKLFVFGGWNAKRRLNDIWALDLNSLKSKPFWESYEPAPGNEKPLPRCDHVSVTTAADHIIIYGGFSGQNTDFDDTWSFDVSTRKWTKLQCTGSIPSPRSSHAAVLIGDVMYVFGGIGPDETKLGDLAALNLSTQRWTSFKAIGSSPCRRRFHTMASDGGRVFVLGGKFSQDAQVDESKLIHVLDTKLLDYPKPEGQPQHEIFSSSDARAAHGAFPFQIAPSASGGPRRIPLERDDGEGSTEPHTKLVSPDAPSEKESARLEDGRLIELERQLSETLVAKAERDRRITQLSDELALNSALLEQAEKEKEGAKLGLRELQAVLDELLLSHDHVLEQAEANTAEEKESAGLELRKLQAKLDDSLLSRDRALKQDEANAAEEKYCAGLELRKLQAKLVVLDKSLLSRDRALQQAEANTAEEKVRVGLELHKLQVRLDESLLSRDHALEQAQSALQKASFAAEANEQSRQELAEMRANLEASKSESAALRLQLADTEIGCSRNKAGADTNQTATGLVNTDEGRVVHRLLERMQAMEAEIASLRLNEKSFDMMECRNEG